MLVCNLVSKASRSESTSETCWLIFESSSFWVSVILVFKEVFTSLIAFQVPPEITRFSLFWVGAVSAFLILSSTTGRSTKAWV